MSTENFFDDDTALWKYVLNPLINHQPPTRFNALQTKWVRCSNQHVPNAKDCWLPFLRSVRLSLSTNYNVQCKNNGEGIDMRERKAEYPFTPNVRPLLLLESICIQRHIFGADYCDGAVSAFTESLRRLQFLKRLTFESNDLCPQTKLLKAVPNPQQLTLLHIPNCPNVPQAVFDKFTSLEDLDVSGGRYNLNNVHFCCATLRRLMARKVHALSDDGLVNATKLEVLDVTDCSGVTTVDPFVATLVELHAGGDCGIDDKALRTALNIRRLFVEKNRKITTVKPFAEKLIELDAARGIDDEGLREATSIVKLRVGAMFTPITTVTPFAGTLRELEVHSMLLNDDSLADASGIVKLDVSRSMGQVRTVKPFARAIRELHVSAGFHDDGVVDATGIVRLRAFVTCSLTTMKPFAASLLELDAGKKGINDETLKDLTTLVKLNVENNSDVTTVAPFSSTLRELRANGRDGIDVDDALREAPGIGRLVLSNQSTPVGLSFLWRE